MSNILFRINGGIGKCIMATAVLSAIKKKYRKDNIIVISGYPDVFLNHPAVHKSFNHGNTTYFYRDFIEKKEFKVIFHDPYEETAYFHQNESLIKTWCEMFGIPYNGEMPNIHLTQREIDFFQNDIAAEFRQHGLVDKPILILQTNGGAENQPVKYSWARDMPGSLVVKLIDELKEDHTIVHLRREDQPSYPGTITFNAVFRKVFVLLQLSQKRLLIDSFAQHACAALGLPAVVCWIANKPEVFGYKMHKNILANKWTAKPELKNSFMQPFNIIGDPLEFPYKNETDIFDADTILEALG